MTTHRPTPAPSGSPPTDREVLEGVIAVAREHLGHQGGLSPEQPLIEALRLDSLRMLTLVAEVENRFQVSLEEGDEIGLVTVGDLVALLQRRLAT